MSRFSVFWFVIMMVLMMMMVMARNHGGKVYGQLFVLVAASGDRLRGKNAVKVRGTKSEARRHLTSEIGLCSSGSEHKCTWECRRGRRNSANSHGCLVLFYVPKCTYVRLQNCKDRFLASDAGAPQTGSADLHGALAVEPVTRSWRYNSKDHAGHQRSGLLTQKQGVTAKAKAARTQSTE